MSKGLQQYYDYIDNNIEAPCQRYGYKRDKIKKVCNIKMSDKEIEDTMTKYVDSDSYQEDLDVFFKKNTKSTRFQQYNDYVNENIGAPCHRYGYKRQDGTEICIKMSDKEIENKMTEYVKSGKYNKDFKEFKTSRNITPQLHQYFDYIQDKQELNNNCTRDTYGSCIVIQNDNLGKLLDKYPTRVETDAFLDERALRKVGDINPAAKNMITNNVDGMFTGVCYSACSITYFHRDTIEESMNEFTEFSPVRWDILGCKLNILFVPINIQYESFGHANIMLINKTKKVWVIDYFEPHGIAEWSENVQTFVERYLSIILNNQEFVFKKQVDVCPYVKGQMQMREHAIYKGPGLCQTWVIYYILLRLCNPNLSNEQIQLYLSSLNAETLFGRLTQLVLFMRDMKDLTSNDYNCDMVTIQFNNYIRAFPYTYARYALTVSRILYKQIQNKNLPEFLIRKLFDYRDTESLFVQMLEVLVKLRYKDISSIENPESLTILQLNKLVHTLPNITITKQTGKVVYKKESKSFLSYFGL